MVDVVSHVESHLVVAQSQGLRNVYFVARTCRCHRECRKLYMYYACVKQVRERVDLSFCTPCAEFVHFCFPDVGLDAGLRYMLIP